jgi:hypothetical protein
MMEEFHDGVRHLVRVTGKQFLQLPWKHLFTTIDSVVLNDAPENALVAGSTEWTAHFLTRKVSIGWDWYCTDFSAAPVLLTTVRPRSNVMLLDGKGYDQSDDVASEMIFQCLASDFWHADVMNSYPTGGAL